MVKKRFYVSIILLILMGCLLFSGWLKSFKKMVSVEGVVKKYNDNNAVIEYSINGEKRWYKVTASNYEDGEKVTLVYEENDVEKVFLPEQTNSSIILVVFIVLFILLLPSIYEYIIYCNVPKKGTKIEVDYVDTEVIINNGSLSTYVMKFKWMNPETNEIHYLINEDFTNFDPKDIIEEKNVTKFIAYINLKQPNQYRVMIDELLKDVYINKEKIIMM